MGFWLLPKIALIKFVKNVLFSFVKYAREGIQRNGMASIWRASINDATNIKRMGVIVKKNTIKSAIHATISPTPTLPTYLFVFISTPINTPDASVGVLNPPHE